MVAVTIYSDFGVQENKICHCFHFSRFTCHEVMRPDAMILVSWISFKPAFSLSYFTFIKRIFSSSLLSAIRVVLSTYLRLLAFLLEIRVNEAEVDIFFLEFSCFFYDPVDVGDLLSGSSAFSKSSLNIWKFLPHKLLKPSLEEFEHSLASMWNELNCMVVWTSFGLPFFGIGVKTDIFTIVICF